MSKIDDVDDLIYADGSPHWKGPSIQEKYHTHQSLVLLREPYSRGCTWIDIHICSGDFGLTYFQSLPLIAGWSTSSKSVQLSSATNHCLVSYLISLSFCFLQVLYKFLEYFSKFDWDKYCISLSGPVCRSSLPEIVGKHLGLSLSKFEMLIASLKLFKEVMI